MHNLLDDYLADVTARLGPLPAKARADELREMRAHLEAALAAGLERGQTEDEAARGVLAQFGAPDAVGAETVRAWRRGRGLDRRSFWGAAACFWVTWLLLLRLLDPWAFPHSSQEFYSVPFFWNAVALLLWRLPQCFLAGVVTGFISPKHGVAGTIAFMAVCSSTFPLAYSQIPPSPIPNSRLFWTIIANVAVAAGVYVVCALAAVLGAWVVSRWRTHGGRGGVRVA